MQVYQNVAISAIKHGGYVVHGSFHDGMLREILFACTDMDDALKFIKDNLRYNSEVTR